MFSILIQTVFPFIFSALIVIIITVIAEKYGTKVGGILGTMPSTIIIAFIFIALNKGLIFASESVAVVPAELAINLIFLFVFALFVHRSTIVAMSLAFLIWTILSLIIYFLDLKNIYFSVLIYIIALFFTFILLEFYKKIPSVGKVHIHYTYKKIFFRGVLAGIIITISVLLSNFGAVISGIFSVFPAILSSTMLISVREHGAKFAAGMAKSMIFGISSVCIYAIIIHFLYPLYGIIFGTVVAFVISFFVTLILYSFRNKIG
jgi:hypothetical protein